MLADDAGISMSVLLKCHLEQSVWEWTNAS